MTSAAVARWRRCLFAGGAPTACVFGFMNETARSQAESAKRSVTEAYLVQLRLLRARIDSHWTHPTIILSHFATSLLR